MAKSEGKFQADLINEIEERFPGSLVLKNDAQYKQGIPDLSVFYNGKWAWLEDKKSKDARHRPNQDFYIQLANDMGGFGRFIYPENKEEVLHDMEQAFGPRR